VVEGVVWSGEVVVFSAQPFGSPAPLPFTYRVRDAGKRRHTLVDMAGSCDIAVTRAGGFVTVRVSPGSGYHATDGGMVRFSD